MDFDYLGRVEPFEFLRNSEQAAADLGYCTSDPALRRVSVLTDDLFRGCLRDHFPALRSINCSNPSVVRRPISHAFVECSRLKTIQTLDLAEDGCGPHVVRCGRLIPLEFGRQPHLELAPAEPLMDKVKPDADLDDVLGRFLKNPPDFGSLFQDCISNRRVKHPEIKTKTTPDKAAEFLLFRPVPTPSFRHAVCPFTPRIPLIDKADSDQTHRV